MPKSLLDLFYFCYHTKNLLFISGAEPQLVIKILDFVFIYAIIILRNRQRRVLRKSVAAQLLVSLFSKYEQCLRGT